MSRPKRKVQETPVWNGELSKSGKQNSNKGWTLVHYNNKSRTAKEQQVKKYGSDKNDM